MWGDGTYRKVPSGFLFGQAEFWLRRQPSIVSFGLSLRLNPTGLHDDFQRIPSTGADLIGKTTPFPDHHSTTLQLWLVGQPSTVHAALAAYVRLCGINLYIRLAALPRADSAFCGATPMQSAVTLSVDLITPFAQLSGVRIESLGMFHCVIRCEAAGT